VPGAFTATGGASEGAPRPMADWLVYLWGGFLTVSAVLIAYFAWAYNYFKGELKDDPKYCADTADALTGHVWLASYGRWLGGALGWLDRWMGRPASVRALGVCLTIALVCVGRAGEDWQHTAPAEARVVAADALGRRCGCLPRWHRTDCLSS
jgi:hypothetical protein